MTIKERAEKWFYKKCLWAKPTVDYKARSVERIIQRTAIESYVAGFRAARHVKK